MAKTAFKNKEEAIEYLNTLPLGGIINLCADLLVERQTVKKITITQEQFNSMFKIVGIREDGTAENRGRTRKSEE